MYINDGFLEVSICSLLERMFLKACTYLCTFVCVLCVRVRACVAEKGRGNCNELRHNSFTSFQNYEKRKIPNIYIVSVWKTIKPTDDRSIFTDITLNCNYIHNAHNRTKLYMNVLQYCNNIIIYLHVSRVPALKTFSLLTVRYVYYGQRSK